jgi:hypothetical protein
VSNLKIVDKKIIKVCMLTTFLYFISFFLAARIFTYITHTPIDLGRKASGPVIGICLVIIPYIFNGLYCRKVFSNPFKGALITSLILVVSERILIYLIGFLLVLNGGDGSMNGITTLMFIQGEAAPYFTTPYIVMGIFSICISVFVSQIKKPRLFISRG